MWRRAVVCLTLVATVLAVAACSDDTAAYTHPAAVAVAEVLELRSAGNADPASYEPYFSDSTLAAQLAENTTPGTRAVPDWEAPYLSTLNGATAMVVVRWSDAAQAFPDWPKVTVFSLASVDGQWVVIDATDPTDATPPPLTDARIAAETVDE